jgi:acyl-CoA thioester hydrolase
MMDDYWHETKIRVRYKDTDRMNVVYYGNYLTFFEVGRAELMRHLGFSYADFEKQGYTLMVIEAAAKYYANVGYDALVTVKTKITDLRKVRMRFVYEVFDEAGNLLVNGHTIHACMNQGKKPVKIPDAFRKIVQERFK